MFRIIKWLIALPIDVLIFLNACAYGDIITYCTVAPYQTAFMSMKMKQFAQEGSDVPLGYRWVSYNQISPSLKKAPIVSEDAESAEHAGLGWDGIQYAIKRNRKTGKVKAGGSTTSQQLVKNLFLDEGRSYTRKSEEATITAMTEAVTDRDRIFELCLSPTKWHYGVFGVEATAQKFLHKPAANLGRQQAASLAAHIPAPLFYANNLKSKRLRVRTSTILRRMDSAELPNTE